MPGNRTAFHAEYLGFNGDQPPTGNPPLVKFSAFALAKYLLAHCKTTVKS
jgi:hypothetical protein